MSACGMHVIDQKLLLLGQPHLEENIHRRLSPQTFSTASLRMARAVESSDDELPSLEEVIRSAKPAGSSKATPGPRSQRKQSKKIQGGRDNEVKDARNDGETFCLEQPRKMAKEECQRPRRRVLKPASENPLLRPLTVKASKTAPAVSTRTKPSLPTTSRPLKSSITSTTRNPSAASSVANEREEQNSEGKAQQVEIENGEEEDDDFLGESDSLSDFIVNDSETDFEVSVLDEPEPAPRSTRRLVRGRKPFLDKPTGLNKLDHRLDSLKLFDESSSSEEDAGGESFRPKKVTSDIFEPGARGGKSGSDNQTSQDVSPGKKEGPSSRRRPHGSSSELDDPFAVIRL